MPAQTSIGENDGVIRTEQVASSTGPFDVDFPFFNLDDVIVTLTDEDGVITTLVRGVDYTLTATANDDGIYPSGSVTLADAVENTIVTRKRETPLSRVSQFPTTGTFNRVSLNAEMNRLFVAMQDLQRQIDQFIRFPDEDGADISMVVPAAAQRANRYFTWDADGNATVAETVDVGDLVLNSFWADTMLPLSSEAAVAAQLGVPTLTGDNVWTGAQTFNDDVTAGSGLDVDLSAADTVTVPTPDPAANNAEAATTAWTNTAIADAVADLGGGGAGTLPTFHEYVAGQSGNFTVPAGAIWMEVQFVAGGGGGDDNISNGTAGGNTTFDGITAHGGGAGTLVANGAGGSTAVGSSSSGFAVKIISHPGQGGGSPDPTSAGSAFPVPGANYGAGGGGQNFGAGAGQYVYALYAGDLAGEVLPYSVGSGGATSPGIGGILRIIVYYDY